MVLAFRLYGDFFWPPRPKPTDVSAARRKGIVEIHYLDKTGTGVFRPLLRWIPGEKLPPEPDFSNVHESIYKFSIDQAVAWFESNAGNDCSIWIDEGGKGNADWVSFRGAFLIEQYKAPAPQGQTVLDFRWPLVRSCQYVSGMTVYSGLVIGRVKKPRYYLDLNLPLPARRSTRPDNDDLNPAAFPFGAVYEPRDGKFEDILKFTTLVGGWIKGDAIDTAEAEASGTSFVFGDNQYPDGARLGAFGFSARGKPSEGGFAVYDGQQKHRQINAARFWPNNSRPFTEDMLTRYGFSTSAEWPRLKAGSSTADLSLRFRHHVDEKGATVASIVYRVAVLANGADPNAGDDIMQGQKGLSLRLLPETGGLVETAEALYADCTLSWTIEDKKIWSIDDRAWSPRVELTLHWANSLSDKEFLHEEPWKGSHPGLGLLRPAARSLRGAREGLKSTEAAQPRSIFPDLRSKGAQTVRLCLYGPTFQASYGPQEGVARWGKDTGSEAPFVRPHMRLTLAGMGDLIPGSDDTSELDGNRLTLIASKQTLFNGDSEVVLALSRDDDWADAQADKVTDGEPYFASYRIRSVDPQTALSGRLSSLAFDWTPPDGPLQDSGKNAMPLEEQTTPHLRIGGRGTREGSDHAGLPVGVRDGPIAASLQLVLPVSRVEPVGVDVARADRSGRPAPLLIPLGGSVATTAQNRYWLSIRETIAPRQNRWIEADIYESAPDAGARNYAVFSQEPFAILRYALQPLADRGDAGSASVAYYSSDDGIWQYRTVADHYHYILPPQAVGESADKPRRLEIHDLAAGIPDDSLEALRPYTKEFDHTGKEKPESSLKRRAVEFRLTPSTEIWIRPSDVERGYFMPEATSHEIFRQRGEYGLGAALAYLRGEFLYGLSVGINVSRERSTSRQARVAEIEALTGRIVGPARDADAEKDLKARWNALSRAVARRPERLEIWARDPDSAIDFAPARFSDGVTHALRATALHRPPLAKLEQPGDEALWPKIGRATADVSRSEDDIRFDQSKPRSHPQGLSGGALWPLESINLFNEMVEQPKSSGSVIESIALSPAGGDAVQKAAFLSGIVTIISETRNGHVERQQVEVLGRIGAFWHRAKHVVVYGRTTNASAQFAPKFGEDADHTRSRRPILRKVSEYIELLEPERTYPDRAEAVVRSTGFLERVRFNSKIINVDSAWSSEVGDYGWKIPLWNLLGARERPQVYPMPDIAFVTIAEGDGDKPVVSQECIDTDNLFFFSDFKAGTSDTDTWEERLDIDYANMPVATAIAESADAKSAKQADEGRRRGVSRVLPGLRRFTWRLAPAAQKTAINAGRAGKPVYVGLDSVSFMRAAHTGSAHKELKGGLSRVLAETAAFPQTDESVNGIGSLSYWGADGQGTDLPEAAEYSNLIGQLINALEAGHKSGIEAALAALETEWVHHNLPKKLMDRLNTAAGNAREKLANLTSLATEFDQGTKFCEKLKTDATVAIRRKEMLICSALSDWTADIENNFPTLDLGAPLAGISRKGAVIEELAGLIVSHLRPIFADASADIGHVAEGAEKARAIVAATEADIEAIFARGRQRVEQFSASYDREKPWSVERRRSFRSGLQASVSNVVADIASTMDEARQRLAAELEGASQSVAGHLSKTLTAISVSAEKELKAIADVAGELGHFVTPVREVVDELAPETGSGRLDEAIARIEAVQADIDGATGISADLRKTATETLGALIDAATQAKTLLGQTRILLAQVVGLTESRLSELGVAISALAANATSIVDILTGKTGNLATIANDLIAEGFTTIADAFAIVWGDIDARREALSNWLDNKLLKISEPVDFLVAAVLQRLTAVEDTVGDEVRAAFAIIDSVFDDVQDAAAALKDALGPEQLLKGVVREKIIKRALETLLAPLNDDLSGAGDSLKIIHGRLTELSKTAGSLIADLKVEALGELGQLTAVCESVFEGVKETRGYLQHLAGDFGAYANDKLKKYQPLVDQIRNGLGDLQNTAASLAAAVKAFDHSVRGLQNDLSRSMETARMYGDRVMDAVSRIGEGGAMALPSKALKLYSAVSTAPEIAALKADIDRIRSGFDEISNVIDTTEVTALFNRLGDELKALGLDMPFDKISDRLQLKDLKLGSFGGLNCDHLFKGEPMPASLRDAVRVSHDFDKAQARAWVQVDIDGRIPGRRTLFSLGVFQVDFIDMHLTGQVRLEASKDEDRATQTGFSRIGTTIDVGVAGQSMVRFDQFGLNFTREKGLDVEFDPKNIRLNPSFKFIQDFLSTLFPDKVGGLKIIKQDNIPVGVEHAFVIPPMTLNFGTSGVSNISIENHFKLLAYPDFMIANRFNLSTMERPFIFSIFIIGGTGYVQIDAEYRPFDSQLMVSVEAGAGGSAALAFAVGPFVGQVFITLSGVMTYRKMIGKPGGGLSLAVVLVIAGHVQVCGIVSVGITLTLRMSYRDNGEVDGRGTLSVTIRISRFFKISAHANVNYKLRGGKSETSVSGGVSGEIADEKLATKVKQAKQAVEQLQKAST